MIWSSRLAGDTFTTMMDWSSVSVAPLERAANSSSIVVSGNIGYDRIEIVEAFSDRRRFAATGGPGSGMARERSPAVAR